MTVGFPVLDEWDFYPCRVDDNDASIFLNLYFERAAPLPSASTLYWVRFEMRDVGPHGMGTAAEAEILAPIADRIVERGRALDFYYVGRLRSDGLWSLFLYGPAEHLETLRALATDNNKLDGRRVDVGSKEDPDWRYYRDFLLPSPERRQWMSDRRTLEVLHQHGDPLLEARRVDHWAFFPTAAARQNFITATARNGFASEDPFDDAEGTLPYCARVQRVDPVDLEGLHAVVMRLCDLAGQAGGKYDGWETVVLAKPPN